MQVTRERYKRRAELERGENECCTGSQCEFPARIRRALSRYLGSGPVVTCLRDKSVNLEIMSLCSELMNSGKFRWDFIVVDWSILCVIGRYANVNV